MKINNVLLTSIIASFLWGATADEGALRGLKKAFLDKGETPNNDSAGTDVLSIEISGDATSVTAGDAEEFGQALTGDCLGFNADSLTWSVVQTSTSETRRRLGAYSFSYSGRKKRDNSDRRLTLTTPEEAMTCMGEGFCKNSSNTACAATLKVASFAIE